MKFEPLAHQRLAIDHLTKNPEALLFAGMGLGKTAAVLAATDHLFADGDMRGLLVVAPLRVSVLTWPDEVRKWGRFQYMRIVSLRTREGVTAWQNHEAHIYTINYELLPSFINKHIKGVRSSELPVDSVLFDEVDNAKNPGSKRIKAFRNFVRPKLRRCWGMTGTPVSNSRLDLFAQVRLIDEGKTFGTTFGPWEKQHFEPDNYHSDHPKMVLRPGSAELLEQAISHLALVLRSEDWLKIPPVRTVDVSVSLPKEAKKQYKTVEKELIELLSDGSEIVAVNQAVLANKLLQITGGAVYVRDGEDETTKRPVTLHTAKLDALAKLHKSIDYAPLLVATQYRHEVDRICAAFPNAHRWTNDILPRWNAGKVPMIVAHPKSIGHGLNLQHGGCNVCWFSLSYSRALYDQFNARLVRQGQTQETTIYRLIAPGTIDDAVAEALRTKGDDQGAFLKTLQNIRALAAV